MNKRQFLIGLLGTAGVALTPKAIDLVIAAAPEINYDIWFEEWGYDVLKVTHIAYSNMILYGKGGTRIIDTYPYIESVDPSELEDIVDSTVFKGLL